MTNRSPEFSGYDDVFAAPVVFADCFAEDFFGDAVGVTVSGIVEVDAYVVASLENGKRVFLFNALFKAAAAATKGHAADADAGDSEAGLAKVGIFHHFEV